MTFMEIPKNPFYELEALEAIKKRAVKAEYLRSMSSTARELLRVGLDGNILFGAKQLPPLVNEQPLETGDLFNAEVFLANHEEVREHSSPKQYKMWLELLHSGVSPLGVKWLNRILCHNMRIGVTAKSFNKVFPGSIKFFSAKLCGTYDFKTGGDLAGKWFAEPKYDGMRVYLEFPEGGPPRVLSRSGKPVPGVQPIAESMIYAAKEICKHLGWDSIVFDGEVMDANRQLSIGNARSSSKKSETLKVYLWDMFAGSQWQDKKVVDSKSYLDRRNRLRDCLSREVLCEETCHAIEGMVDVVPVLGLFDQPTDKEIWKTTLQAIESGYEGIILKRSDSKYVMGRNDDWLKAKRLLTAEFCLLRVEMGNGRLADTVGKLIVDVNGVEVGVGSGLTDADREFFLRNQEELIENQAMIECGFQGYTPDGSLDFPRFIRHRKPE